MKTEQNKKLPFKFTDKRPRTSSPILDAIIETPETPHPTTGKETSSLTTSIDINQPSAITPKTPSLSLFYNEEFTLLKSYVNRVLTSKNSRRGYNSPSKRTQLPHLPLTPPPPQQEHHHHPNKVDSISKPKPLFSEENWKTFPSAPWPSTENTGVTPSDLNINPDPFYAKSIPDGSVFKNFKLQDAIDDKHRRDTKYAKGSSYFERVMFFNEVQAKRETVPKGKFKTRMRFLTLREEDLNRIERIEEMKRRFIKALSNGVKAHFIAWSDQMRKSKRVRRMMFAKMGRLERRFFTAWFDLVRKYKMVRRIMFSKIEDMKTRVFKEWRKLIIQKKRIMKLMKDLLSSLLARTFRKLARYVKHTVFIRKKLVIYHEKWKNEKFMRWKKYAATSLKLKRSMLNFFVGTTRRMFTSWRIHVVKMGKVKSMFDRKMLIKRYETLKTWRSASKVMKVERIEREKWEQAIKPGDFMEIDNWGEPAHNVMVKSMPVTYRQPRAKFRMY